MLAKIKSITKIEAPSDRYDLEVEDNHNYYANGILVHNCRLITIITHDKNTGKTEIKSYSRKGKEFTTCQRINDELLHYYKESKFYGQNIVFDGEACIVDQNGKEDWNNIISEIKRKDYTMEHPKYFIFDFLTLDEFTGLKKSHDYTFRRDQMIRNFFGFKMEKFNYLNIVFATPYSEEKVDRLTKDFVETEKWEGLIFRKNATYKPGRTTDLIKFKLFKDAEYRVIDVELTEKPMLIDGKMVPTTCVGALKIKLENGSICGVGTGLSDEQRIQWMKNPNEIVGKQIQVKYKEQTKNADGTWSLQFPVLVHVFEEDRDF